MAAGSWQETWGHAGTDAPALPVARLSCPKAAQLQEPRVRIAGIRQVAVSPAAQQSRGLPGSVGEIYIASPAPILACFRLRELAGVHIQSLFRVWLHC